MNSVQLSDQYGMARNRQGAYRTYDGEVEIEVRSSHTGALIDRSRSHNIIKIFAKEIIAHRIPYSKVWDPTANGGVGAWLAHGIDIDEFALKYITFGASFDANGAPLDTADSRFYYYDDVSSTYVSRTLDVGATNNGGLINAIPIAEPNRPLKRIERVYFQPSYQPAGVPLLQDDVRAVNNVLVLETVLRKDEYNGFGVTNQDFFTITEVGLVGAKEIGTVGACECNPRDIFLTGDDGVALGCYTSGTATITLDENVDSGLVGLIKEGDQVKIVAENGNKDAGILGQVSPYYLVLQKSSGGRDIVLDRTPVNSSNVPLSGKVGVFRDGFKLFSHRLLAQPVKKSIDFEVTVRWIINLS